jgi:hypothetical protein
MTGEHPELDAYVDGALDAAARARVDAHLATCDRCASEVATLIRLDRELGALPVPDPGPRYWDEFAARVAERLGQEQPRPQVYERLTGWLFKSGRPAWWRAAGALAACSVLVWVGMRGFRSPDLPEGQLGSRPAAPAPPAAEPRAAVPAPPAVPAPREEPILRVQEPMAKVEVGPKRARGGRAAEPQLVVAPEPPEPGPSLDDRVAADAASRFLAAATEGDTAGARAVLAGLSAAESGELGAPMRRWLAASGPSEPRSKAIERMRFSAERQEGAPAPPPAAALTPTPETGRALAPTPAAQLRPDEVEALLALDDIAWPRRDRAELRPALETLALRLASHGSDPRATGRARAILEWLVLSSRGEEERARWDAALQLLPAR